MVFTIFLYVCVFSPSELEKRLKCRPERDNLVEKNILLGLCLCSSHAMVCETVMLERLDRALTGDMDVI